MLADWLDLTIVVGFAVLVFGLFALIYLAGPFLIYFTQKLEAEPRLVPFDVDDYDWPPPIRKLFFTTDEALREEGFEMVAGFYLPTAANNVKTSLLLFVNRETRDSAMATAMYGVSDIGDAPQTLYVEFTCRFTDERVVNTLNSRELGSFPTPPHVTTSSVPTVRDARRLFRIHQFVAREIGGRSQKVLRLDSEFDGDCERYLKFAVRESYEEAAKAGYIFRTGRHFRPTLIGSFLMVWKELWPWKMIRRAKRDRAAAQLLARFDLQDGPSA